MGRPRLCPPLPPLPAAADVDLSRHAVERYIARCCGVRRMGFRQAERELRELRDAGEVVRGWPAFLGGRRRFELRPEVYAYVVVEHVERPFALPVQVGRHTGRPTATTLLVPRSGSSSRHARR